MRITIREKKVAVIRMLVGHMERTHKQMNEDLEKYDGDILKAVLDGHFEGLRCSSGNLSLVLDFQMRYAARYLTYVITGNDDVNGQMADELMEINRYLQDLKRDVILECSCDAAKFCHRLLLYHLLIDWIGEEYAGGELQLKEGEKK